MQIHVLSEETINRIAAGEVVERPVNVVKELVENAIDAGSTAITCEIREGGMKMIRVTDNGCGIEASQITRAFMRHATSKIEDDRDLSHLYTLGFRGEALSSIASVAQVEMITKTADSLTGVRATNQTIAVPAADDTVNLDVEEIGAPDGTSVVVRNLFYNVPVRKKFMKSAQTETGYITDLIQQQALSHPSISFHYRVDGKDKLHTTGSGDLKELIYRIYGRDVMNRLIPIREQLDDLRLEGFIGRPEISRGTRGFEVFFVNERMLKSKTLSAALEKGYRTDLMQHRFPFGVLHLILPPEYTDVNVHPTKMEIHFTDTAKVSDFIENSVQKALHSKDLIPEILPETTAEQAQRVREEAADRVKELAATQHIEPFEQTMRTGTKTSLYEKEPDSMKTAVVMEDDFVFEDRRVPVTPVSDPVIETVSSSAPYSVTDDIDPLTAQDAQFEQIDLFPGTDFAPDETPKIMDPVNAPKFRLIGQFFKTYWLIEYEDKLLMVDQHAAHEKVNYERIMRRVDMEKNQAAPSQMIAPPIVVSLTGKEEGALQNHMNVFRSLGYEIEDFGGGSYAIRAIPLELYGAEPKALLRDTLEEILNEKMTGTPHSILMKIASMSCKAAVKGNSLLSVPEAQALISELLTLDNPYHCPHGRPTMISFTQYDIDRKFKRIV